MKRIYFLSVLFLGFCLLGCTKMDDYKRFFDDQEIIYIGKPDSVKVFSGRERVDIQWLIISDPKVSSATIYWNNRSEQKKVDIQRGTGVDTVRTTIDGLTQGFHTFELFTMDQEGNRSVSVSTSGMVYGDNYEASLPNRSVDGVKYEPDGNTFVSWLLADSASIGVSLSYETILGNKRIKYVSNNELITELEGCDPNKQIFYQTMYKPDPTAIDTFYAPEISLKVNEILLKNGGSPFRGTNISGRWGNLESWDTNTAAKNHNGVGGFDNVNNGGFLSFEYWGTPAIINGKISQSIELPSGKYRLVARISNIDYTCEATFMLVCAGSNLSNVESINSAIASFRLTDKVLNNKDIIVLFELDAKQLVTLGFLSTMLQNNPTSVRISSVRLYRDNE